MLPEPGPSEAMLWGEGSEVALRCGFRAGEAEGLGAAGARVT